MNAISCRVRFFYLVMLFPIRSFACSCGGVEEFKTAGDLKHYDFIALAEVTGLADPAGPGDPWFRKNGDIRISILELFKGEPIGLLNDSSVNTSCGLDLEAGQQWLFFGAKDTSGRMLVGSCSHTVKYRDATGLRDWQYFRGMPQLELLRKVFNKPDTAKPERIVRYANGRTEVDQHFRNGRLHGIRKIYYPTGGLYVAEKFSRGKRKGYRKIYGKSGLLAAHTTYAGSFKRKQISYVDPLHIEGELLFEARNRLRIDALPTDELSQGDQSRVRRVADSLKVRALADPVETVWRLSANRHGSHYRAFFPGARLHTETRLDWKERFYSRSVYDGAGCLVSRTVEDGKAGVRISEEFDAKGSVRKSIGTPEGADSHFAAALIDAEPEPVFLP